MNAPRIMTKNLSPNEFSFSKSKSSHLLGREGKALSKIPFETSTVGFLFVETNVGIITIYDRELNTQNDFIKSGYLFHYLVKIFLEITVIEKL